MYNLNTDSYINIHIENLVVSKPIDSDKSCIAKISIDSDDSFVLCRNIYLISQLT